MTINTIQAPATTTFLSEIFPLTLSNQNLSCFHLKPEIDRYIGNRLSWHFSKYFPNIVVIWYRGYFWILAKLNQEIPTQGEWKDVLLEIQEKLQEDIGNRNYSIQWVNETKLTPQVEAELAVRTLKIARFSSPKAVFTKNKVKIQREVKFWSEIIELDNREQPAIALTVDNKIVYSEDLEKFYYHHCSAHNLEKILIGLKVRDRERGSFATIRSLAGNIGERREELIAKATGKVSRQKLKLAPDNQPLVSVSFGKDSKLFDYPLAALRPCITSGTVDKFGVEYGELLTKTRVSYGERQKLLKEYKEKASDILSDYGFSLRSRCVNSKDDRNLFWIPEVKLEETKILFGNHFIGKKNQVLAGLKQGGVYRRHREFNNPERKIRLAILKLFPFKAGEFRQQLQKNLKRYGFDSILPDENKKYLSLEGLSATEARAKVESIVDSLVEVPPDIVLVLLPQSDRNADKNEGGSLYSWVYSRLLRRHIASQMIYENTLKKNEHRYILNQIVPGILAKLGNIPFVLAEPLDSAHYFMGLDVCHMAKKNKPGSRNACASIRLYNQQGAFLRYQLADDLIEGEEIPQRTLENFLPKADLRGKKVLIYRDGLFRGNEVKYLLARGQAIGAKLILVECYKSGSPRLFSLREKQLHQPSRGLVLQLSPREIILITTQVPEHIGTPLPLRLKIHQQGEQIPLPNLVNTTLKLTLLHHGSLKDPRLPIPLFGADKIAYRRLQGIYPGSLEGDRQYWL